MTTTNTFTAEMLNSLYPNGITTENYAQLAEWLNLSFQIRSNNYSATPVTIKVNPRTRTKAVTTRVSSRELGSRTAAILRTLGPTPMRASEIAKAAKYGDTAGVYPPLNRLVEEGLARVVEIDGARHWQVAAKNGTQAHA